MNGNLRARLERLEASSPVYLPIVRRLAISDPRTESEAQLAARIEATHAEIRAQHGRDGLVLVRRIVDPAQVLA
jgi:hypothetical protein